MISPSFDHFDPIEEWIEYRGLQEIAEIDYEFKEWLEENNYYIAEAAADSSQAHQQWKINTTNKLKSTVMRFGQFSLQQIAKDSRLLQAGKAIVLNAKQFPPKENLYMKSAPNYAAALSRVSAPITTHLNSIDLTQVDTNGKNPKSNIQIKKTILPSYDGKSEFTKYAKNYFYGGEGKRADMGPQECAMLLPLAYQFCVTYETRVKGLQTEIAALISYISRDPQDGSLKAEHESDIKKLQAMKQQNAMQTQGQASTNPNVNAMGGQMKPVNADTNYEYFMRYYFTEDTPITQQPTISGNKPAPLNPTQSKSPAGAPVNTKALSYKKHQTAVDVAIDAFNAKISALSMLYHDFIYLLRAHIASYKGAVAGNDGRTQQQIQPQQQAPQQPQMK